MWWAPWRSKQLGLVFETLQNAYFNNDRSAVFLETLMREIPGRMVVLWDGGGMHKGDPIREAAKRFRPRLSLEKLPPYAPMLNPVEPLWSWLKYSRLCNFAALDTRQLKHRVIRELSAVSDDLEFLKTMFSCFQSGLRTSSTHTEILISSPHT